MTCPTCGRIARDFTNSSGLLTRCDDAWHQICGATHGPWRCTYRTGHPGSHFDGPQGAEWSDHPACPVCRGNGEAMGCPRCLAVALPRHWLADADSSASPARPDDFATQAPPTPHFPHPSHHGASERACDASKDSHFPYTTPVPTLHDGSTGWVYCEACDAPQPVAGHECAKTGPSIATLRAALSKMHARACGDESSVYMSIPADPTRDADLLLSAALDELQRLRDAAHGGGR